MTEIQTMEGHSEMQSSPEEQPEQLNKEQDVVCKMMDLKMLTEIFVNVLITDGILVTSIILIENISHPSLFMVN